MEHVVWLPLQLVRRCEARSGHELVRRSAFRALGNTFFPAGSCTRYTDLMHSKAAHIAATALAAKGTFVLPLAASGVLHNLPVDLYVFLGWLGDHQKCRTGHDRGASANDHNLAHMHTNLSCNLATLTLGTIVMSHGASMHSCYLPSS